MIKKYLIKLKIIDYTSFKIEANKTEFGEKLKKVVDKEGNFFSTMFEAFSSSSNVFKGTVGFDKFELKHKQKIFDNTALLSKAKGTFRQERENIIFDVEINGWSNYMIIFIGFIAIFYLIAIPTIAFTDNSAMSFIILPALLLHGIFMLGIPFFLIRKSVKNLKTNIEKEFFYIAKR